MPIMKLYNLEMAGTEVGTIAGPGAGRELMLLGIGRWLIWGTTIGWVLYGGMVA